MFDKTAVYYDRIYAFKDYAAEAAKVVAVAESEGVQGGRLLDVACGTGLHLEQLAKAFDVEGLDLSQELLDCARRRLPDVPLHCADMRTFDLGAVFDVVTCLFSSIGYMTTSEDLGRAVERMAAHVAPHGVLIVEPWLTPDVWKPGTVHGMFIDEPDLKIARVNTSETVDGVSVFDLHHLIGTPTGTEYVVEHHELGLYTVEEMTRAFANAGLAVRHDPEGLTGRGLYVARHG